MSCDFKPGDEVVCVDAKSMHFTHNLSGLHEGDVYQVARVWVDKRVSGREVNLALVGVDALTSTGGFWSGRFRKVERKTDKLNLTEWLSQPSEFEEPRRPKAPAKKRESA